MERSVIVKVTGNQFYFHYTDTGEEPIEVKTNGIWYEENGAQVIVYEEAYEGFREVTRNTVIIEKDSVRIEKEGVVTSDLIFKKGQKSSTFYTTPFGMMEMGAATTGVEIEILPGSIEVNLAYGLIMSGAYVADCRVNIIAQEI